jgi:hypothetical protein
MSCSEAVSFNDESDDNDNHDNGHQHYKGDKPGTCPPPQILKKESRLKIKKEVH